MTCFIVPPHVIDRLAAHVEQTDPQRAYRIRERNAADQQLRQQRQGITRDEPAGVAPGDVAVYDGQHREKLPGRRVTADLDASTRGAVDGLVAVGDLLDRWKITTLPDVGTVHFGSRYDNAYWDGQQMVFGDGDGQAFGDFAVSLDVCGHERMHGVTGNRLNYSDQAGALNEHLSDAVGIVSRQQKLGLDIQQGDSWLIGAGLLLESGARGLRDMLHPGTAYDTPMLGRDDQPGTMSGYVTGSADNGGVHTNSGIPNRAFALAAVAHNDAVAVLAVWLTALDRIKNPDCTFAEFAQLTVEAAGAQSGLIRQAWVDVEVLAATPTPTPTPTPNGGGDGPFRAAVARYPGLAEALATRGRRKGMSDVEWAAWRLAGDVNVR